jgi:hypothetical protein
MNEELNHDVTHELRRAQRFTLAEIFQLGFGAGAAVTMLILTVIKLCAP